VGSPFGALLTAGLISRTDNIVRANGDDILTRLESVGDICIYGNVTANVIYHVFAVYPNLGLVIASADVEEDAVRTVIPTLGKGDSLAIPYALAEIGVTETRKHALAAEGDGNFLVKSRIGVVELTRSAGTAVILVEFPFAVEVYPIGTVTIRTRMLGTRNIHHNCFLTFNRLRIIFIHYI
jgi:hypothetical protein